MQYGLGARGKKKQTSKLVKLEILSQVVGSIGILATSMEEDVKVQKSIY